MPSIDTILSDAAAKRPDHPLIVQGSKSFSYAEVDRAASAIARGLIHVGIRRGDRVALLLENGPEYVSAYYGIMRATAVVVPLSPDTRTGILTRALAHSGATAAILSPHTSTMLATTLSQLPHLRTIITTGPPQLPEGLSVEQIELTALSDAGTSQAGDTVTNGGADSDELASIVFTSGTTADPKGVMLSHHNLLANAHNVVGYLPLQEDDRVGLVLPFFYSFGTSILNTHVLVGATIVVLGTVAFPAAVLKGIQDQHCTGLPGVPSTFAKLVHSPSITRYDSSSLRYLTQAGGPMTPALTRKLQRAIPGARVYVMYGQTEAGPRLSYLAPDDLDRKIGSVGKAIPGVTLAVVDESGATVGVGTVGELVARGDNIMMGYWQDASATARALRPKGLHTGDMARVDDEGFIFLVGRNSDLIKTGAHRVGPQEIERVIEALPQVAECAIVGLPDELLGEAIAAFVVMAEGAEALSEKQILRACFEQLPRFKTPKHVRFVSSLPRTASGKLNRRALRDVAPGPPSS